MSGTDDRDVTARLAELEATVRGLTQELVSAEQRIRDLEEALEAGDAAAGNGADPATKATPGDAEAASEATQEDAEEAPTDDIIVA